MKNNWPSELQLAIYPVRELHLAEKTEYRAGVLAVGAIDLAERLQKETGLAKITVEVARPGESVRIIHILDAIAPRCKSDSPPGDVFPGFFGPPRPSGSGVTHSLEGMAVLVTGTVPGLVDSQLVSEAILDMSGPAAKYSPFAETLNLVLSCEFESAQGPLERVALARRAGLLAAKYLAQTTLAIEPPSRQVYSLSSPDQTNGPRVAYICPSMNLSALHQTFLDGVALEGTPAVIHPAELFDGAVVSGNYDIAATRNPTYTHQNNPIVRELFDRHARGELIFAGCIVSLCLINGYREKQRSATLAARAAKLLGADGVIISIEECGHSYADLMLTCQACEDLGLDTVLLIAESAGAAGDKAAAFVFAPKADAMISIGNMDEEVTLPRVEKVLGGDSFVGRWPIAKPVEGPATTTLENIFAATCQLGPTKMRAAARMV